MNASGGQEDRRTGGQEDRRTGGQEDRRTGGQEDRRTGGQEDRRTGGQEDRRTGGQEDKRTGGQEDKKTGGQEHRGIMGGPDLTCTSLCVPQRPLRFSWRELGEVRWSVSRSVSEHSSSEFSTGVVLSARSVCRT